MTPIKVTFFVRKISWRKTFSKNLTRRCNTLTTEEKSCQDIQVGEDTDEALPFGSFTSRANSAADARTVKQAPDRVRGKHLVSCVFSA